MPRTPKPATPSELYQQWLECDALAKKKWDERDRILKRLVRVAKMGRKLEIIVPISENRGVRIRDNSREFRKEGKLFAPAFARRWDVKEVPLESA